MSIHRRTLSSVPRPVPPIKLSRMRLRTFRPDSSTPFYGTHHISRTDFVVFITMPRVDALSKPLEGQQ